MSSRLVTEASTRQPITFSLSYDPSNYEPQNKTHVQPSLRCGAIVLPVVANHYSFARLRLDDYDKVRDRIVEKARSENPDFASLELQKCYKHLVRYDVSQREHHRFELLHAEALIEASDEFLTWKASNKDSYVDMEPPIKNLHYTNIGLGPDFSIAEIFQTIDLEKSLPNSQGLVTFSGLSRSYSSTSEGNEGPAHYLVGTYIKPTTTTVTAASFQAASMAKISNRDVTSAHSEPHRFARVLATAGTNDKENVLQELANIPLDLKEVNSSAQTTMTNVMQWHMKEEDRKLFFGASDKPSGLPHELTSSIENTDEGNWIRETYANAYICQILAQSDAQIGSDHRFTSQEKKNVQYFWNGTGKNCLAKSQIYKKLERAISRYQLRKKYEVIGRVYGAGNGIEYSDSLYDIWTGPLQIDELATINATTGTSLLSKICTIMDALDDGTDKERQIDMVVDNHKTLNDTNANHLVLAATSNQKGELWMRQYWGLKSDDERAEKLQ
ncbi:MAG: hypothetical protein Q9191_008420, partial [Dirinaria sp. TL-2023a]